MTVRTALAAAAEIGPFFRVRVIGPEEIDPQAVLARTYADVTALDSRVRATADALDVRDHRVAGSIFFQGLAARLWSPTIAVAVLERRVLRLPPEATTPDDPGLACSEPVLRAEDPAVAVDARSGTPDTAPKLPASDRADGPDAEAELAGGIHRAVIETHLEPLAAALDVPATTLWGNAASAVVGSYQVMTRTRPELTDTGLLRALLRTGRLGDTGRLDDAGRFHRNSCCLFYRVPDGGLCGDCVLHRRTRPPSDR